MTNWRINQQTKYSTIETLFKTFISVNWMTETIFFLVSCFSFSANSYLKVSIAHFILNSSSLKCLYHLISQWNWCFDIFQRKVLHFDYFTVGCDILSQLPGAIEPAGSKFKPSFVFGSLRFLVVMCKIRDILGFLILNQNFWSITSQRWIGIEPFGLFKTMERLIKSVVVCQNW